MIVGKVEQSSELNHAVIHVFGRFRRFDTLINSAGTSTHIPFLELDEDACDNVVDVNLIGTFLCCRAVAPIMVKQRKGSIANISSCHAVKGGVNLAHCSASKAGVLALTKSMTLDLRHMAFVSMRLLPVQSILLCSGFTGPIVKRVRVALLFLLAALANRTTLPLCSLFWLPLKVPI